MNYSYVMGTNDFIYELQKHGFIIEKDRNNYMVSFNDDKSNLWEVFISKNLKYGFWNEYINQNGVVTFLFHLDEGIKKIIVNKYNNEEVLTLCEKLCKCKFESIYKMLKNNHFYNRYI